MSIRIVIPEQIKGRCQAYCFGTMSKGLALSSFVRAPAILITIYVIYISQYTKVIYIVCMDIYIFIIACKWICI